MSNGPDAQPGPDSSADVTSAFDAGADATADADAEAGFAEARHGAFPQAVNSGGPVLSAPDVIPVFFPSDALETDLESLLSQLTTSQYWASLRADYPAVGPLTVSKSVVLTDTPPTTASIQDVANFIAGKLSSNDPLWPATTPNSIYVMYYPSSTTLTLGTAVGCQGFAGYHSSWHTTSNATFVFAAISRCDMLATLDVATQNSTHEIVESTTDPLFGATPAFDGVDDAHAIWGYYPGRELGDLCETESLSYQRMIGSYLVARFWTNPGAASGHDPCDPPLGVPYYNSVPQLVDDVTLTLGGSVVTKGVSVPLGETTTIGVDLFSDAPTTAWTVQAQQVFSTSSPELQFTWDTTSGNNGDTLALTIQRLQNGAIGGTEFVIYSQHGGSDYHAFFAVAGN